MPTMSKSNIYPTIFGINGPVVTCLNSASLHMQEMVHVGNEQLIGEIIGIGEELTTIQVYESTTGLRAGEPIAPSGHPMSLTLGPGILTSIFDGIERPLTVLEGASGAFISRGLNIPALDGEKKWDVTLTVKAGDEVKGGSIFATCPETPAIVHRAMVPPLQSGTIEWAAPDGQYTVNDVIAKLKDKKGNVIELTLAQQWPIRNARPFKRRIPINRPLVTGQRVIDTLFPIAKGGAAAVPGGFGTGKTMTQHQLAKWCDADIIVYVGCGERGNEMTQVLTEFGELTDPRTGRALTDRTVLIANTSNMPVAAREASIYTGITIAEYYRDMGYHVAIMADSTSRWAEALREISGRLEEMPAEEGFPAYLPSRLSQFYERAGYVDALSGGEGSVSIIGAVSPAGGDFSEPVTQNTKRFIRCFWALDRQLAYARHYPAINWLTSYSEYFDDIRKWYEDLLGPKFTKLRASIISLLVEESRLMEIVKLIGSDVLPDEQKLIIEVSRVIRVGFLQQNAFHENDTYVPLDRQYKMMEIIVYAYERFKELVAVSVPMSVISSSGIFDEITRLKYVPDDEKSSPFADLHQKVDSFVGNCMSEYKN